MGMIRSVYFPVEAKFRFLDVHSQNWSAKLPVEAKLECLFIDYAQITYLVDF